MTDPRGKRGFVPMPVIHGMPANLPSGTYEAQLRSVDDDGVYHLDYVGPVAKPEPEPVYGLECADCGRIEMSIEDAAEHEFVESTEDEPHGGWDTVRLS